MARPKNCGRCNKPKSQCNCGRPTVMTPEVIAKLEHAFSIDATVLEAIAYADIGADAFYDYLKKNPKFNDRVQQLRQRPMLKARTTIEANLDKVDTAKWYAEKKAKKEFGARVELTGADGQPLFELSPDEKKAVDKALEDL